MSGETIKDGIAYALLDWHIEIGIRFDVEAKNFRSLKEFRLWAFDPEFNYKRVSGYWKVIWISGAIRLLGIDLGFGLLIRPKQEIDTNKKELEP